MVTPGVFAGGLALLGVALACAGHAGWVLARGRGFVAWAVLATAALIAAHVVPLALGILSRPAVIVASLLIAAAAHARRRRRPTRVGALKWCDDTAKAPRLVWWVGAVAAALAAGAALAYLRTQAGQPILSSDTLNFQLPQVARWIDTGSLWQLDQFFPDYSNATYPQHGNVLLLAIVLPFDSTFLAREVPAVYAVLACVALYAVGREMGAPRAWALLATAVFAAVPVLAKVGLDGANTDTPMAFFFIAGALFLLRGERVLAGVALGLALGTKWYALTTLPPLVAVWALARLAAREPLKRVAADVAVVTGTAVAVGGIWLVRNLVEASNPLFPQPLGPFPAPPDPIREAAGWNLAHYLFDGDVWRRFLLPQFDRFFAAPGYVLFAGGLVVIAIAAWRRAPRPAAVGVAALTLIGGYGLVTYGAFGPEGAPVLAFASTRYALPALAAGAAGLAWAGSRLPRRAQAVAAAALLVVVIRGLITQYDVPWWQIIVAGALLAATTRLPRPVLALGGIVAAVAGAALIADRLNDRSYAGADPVLGWLEEHARAGHHIGLAGIWGVAGVSPVLPAFGPRLDNRVAYAGPFVEHMLRRSPGRADFLNRIAEDDLLVLGLDQGVPREERWARGAGWTPVARSPALALLRSPARRPGRS